MGVSETSFIENLVAREVHSHVTRAKGRIISTSACVDAVLKVYPTCGLARRAIEDMVIAQAARAKVVVEMDGAAPRSYPAESRAAH